MQKSFGQRIMWLRDSLGLSQAAISQAVGVTQTSWARYELDKNEPAYGVILQIENSLFVDAQWLMRGGLRKALCERIKSVMERAGLDSYEFAKRLGVLEPVVKAVVNEAFTPSASFVNKVSQVFGTTLSWLHFGVDAQASAGTDPEINEIVELLSEDRESIPKIKQILAARKQMREASSSLLE